MKSFKQFFVEQSNRVVAIYPGRFAPPHKGHFEALKYLLQNATEGVVYVGTSVRGDITPQMSEEIWNVYRKYIDKPVVVSIAPMNPVRSTYEFVDNNIDKSKGFIVGAGVEDQSRFAGFSKNPEKYSTVKIEPIPPQFGRISGTAVRQMLDSQGAAALSEFIPDVLSSEDRENIKRILLK